VKRAICPSCGAPVLFHSAASVYAVCEFCRSTLLRTGEDLQNLGRMADLLDDTSRIQIGSEGTFRSRHFLVVGRIQLKYEAGLWNEWHILFDDGRSAWLAEAAGEYIVSAQVSVREPIPAFTALVPEMPVTLDGRQFTVTDLETARCISGQGELPFRVAAGYDVNTADLRSNDRFLTIDYSETPPLVFVGQSTTFADLKLVNLRGSARSIGRRRAAGRRARLQLSALCRAAADSLAGDRKRCLRRLRVDHRHRQRERPAARARGAGAARSPLAAAGQPRQLHGVDWEVIGFMRRSTTSAGTEYPWSEYLLFNATDGFAWLIEYQGHWNFARTLAKPPSVSRGQAKFKRDGKEFKLFNSGKAEVTYVVGEFYWRVAVGETCAVDDYVCPPLMLSREVTAKEASWSQAEYLEPADLCAAFRMKTPLPRSGIYANQPNPLVETHRNTCRLFWKLALAATAVQLAFAFLFASQLVLKQQIVLSPQNDEATLTSQEFVLKSRARALLVRHATDVTNNWLSLSTTLVEKNTGESYSGEQEVSHYKGVDDGESWSEGSPSEEMVFKAVPAGTYYLVIEYELGSDDAAAVVDTLEVVRNPTVWSNFVLLLIFLAIFPLISRWRRNAFEARRWSESDLGGKDD
jgi:hypothetical protein